MKLTNSNTSVALEKIRIQHSVWQNVVHIITVNNNNDDDYNNNKYYYYHQYYYHYVHSYNNVFILF